MGTRKLAIIVAGALLASGAAGYDIGYFTAPAPPLTACPAPALPGQNAGYVTSGSRITGIDGSNGLGAGDVYRCINGNGYTS